MKRQGEKSTEPFMWGLLLQLGCNMWSEGPLDASKPIKPEKWAFHYAADHVRVDVDLWNCVTERFAAVGGNLLLIDLGEALLYPSHPELAVKGSWKPERMQKEIARLRGLGLEPIPKLNFSTAHDAWLKEYGRMVSTPEYYKVCADLIRDVCEIFEKPRLFHLGWDEEAAYGQKNALMMVVRQGDLWWHDFLFTVREVEKYGVRPWVWSGRNYLDHEAFMRRMPSSVLQTNSYYWKDFEKYLVRDDDLIRSARWPGPYVGALGYIELDETGRFEQVACGSNWNNDENFELTVKFCHKHLKHKELFKGFLMAPWKNTFGIHKKHLLDACDQVAVGKKLWESLNA